MAKKKRPVRDALTQADPDQPESTDVPPVVDEREPTPEPAPAEGVTVDEPPEAPSDEVAPVAARKAEKIPDGAAWGAPLYRFEKAWTRFESRLITGVLIAQILVLVSWVFLAGLSARVSTTADGGNAAGTVFRGVAGAVILGGIAHFIAKRTGRGDSSSGIAMRIGAIVLGIAIAPLWRGVGVDYFDNVKGWLQEGSTLTLMGGLRGLATRLTLWLALLGASLATAAGKHIHIDVVMHFLPKRLRLPAGLLSFAATALVCISGAWGFFDHIAIESYGAKPDDTARAKVSHALSEFSEHQFLTRKQIGLDLRTIPHVITGDRYDRWMTAGEWNEWVRGAGFEGHFSSEEIQRIIVAEDPGATHSPLVIAPDGKTTRGILVHDLALVFPFGLIMIGLRFILRALLAISGHAPIDPDAAHKEEDDDAEPATAKGAV